MGEVRTLFLILQEIREWISRKKTLILILVANAGVVKPKILFSAMIGGYLMVTVNLTSRIAIWSPANKRQQWYFV